MSAWRLKFELEVGVEWRLKFAWRCLGFELTTRLGGQVQIECRWNQWRWRLEWKWVGLKFEQRQLGFESTSGFEGEQVKESRKKW